MHYGAPIISSILGSVMEGEAPVDVFEELESGRPPRTAWEIAYASVTAKGRDALRDQTDLSAIGLSVIELADAVAEAITRREGIVDPHTTLSDAAVERIHFQGRTSLSTLELRKTAGRLRIAEIERRTKTLINAVMPHIDAAEAVRSVRQKVRRDKSRGITKTLDELAEEVAALALAAADRHSAEPQPAASAASAMVASLGAAATTAFYQAIAGAVETDSLDRIAAGVKDGLGPLETTISQPEALRSQLATTGLLGHNDALRIETDVTSRGHYPFGLRDQESHAYLAAALHVLGAQAGRKNIARASAALASSDGSGETGARKLLLEAIAAEAKQRMVAEIPPQQYQPVPNRFDILRTLAGAQMLPSEEDIPTILGATGNGHAVAARDLLLRTFPFREETTVPWSSPTWRSAGESIRGMLNFEHKILSTLPAFSPREFEDTAVRAVLLGLKNFINILLRAEGERAGYPNDRTTYEHRSAKVLSNTLTARVIGKDYRRIFAELHLSAKHGPITTRSGTNPETKRQPDTAPGSTPTRNDSDEIPEALVILARPELLSLLMEVASLTAPEDGLSPAARRLLTSDPTKAPNPAEAARARDAATACIQFINWAQYNEDPDLTLETAFAEFYRDLSDLGHPPGFNPMDVAELLNDSMALLPDFSEKGTA
jgi:hypothetical protein